MIDNEFLLTFFEESVEHLESVEKIALEIDIKTPDKEMLDAIFRAVHSLKGNAGIFSISEIVDVAQILETILDKVRKKEKKLSKKIIDLILQTKDVIEKQLEARKQGKVAPNKLSEDVSQQLNKILQKEGKAKEVVQETSQESWGLFDMSDVESKNETEEENKEWGLFDSTQAIEQTSTLESQKENKEWGLFEPSSDQMKRRKSDISDSADSPTGINSNETVRVGVGKIDQLINQVGELIIAKAMLEQSIKNMGVSNALQSDLDELERNAKELQGSAMSMRMMPIRGLFNRFPRMVRDISSKLGKEVELKMFGKETEMDKGLLEKLVDPLTHLIRNSLDHGIESAEIRKQAGKSPVGLITLKASQQSGNIVLEVEDDGGGLNRERILNKAREIGIPLKDEMSDDDINNLIFAPSFSTATKVTEVSGRGVGMDVVKKNIQEMNGLVEVYSTPGKGSRFKIKLPLTMAIIEGITFSVGTETYVIPLTAVLEIVQPQPHEVQMISNGMEVVQLRENFLSIVRFYKLFGIKPNHTDPTKGVLLILRSGGNKNIALFVDSLDEQRQIVVRSVEKNYEKISGFGGATILGDGRVAFIVEVRGLLEVAKNYNGKLASTNYCHADYDCYSCSVCSMAPPKTGVETQQQQVALT